MKRNLILVLTTTLALGAVAASPVFAGRHAGGSGCEGGPHSAMSGAAPGIERMAKRLDLSQEQRDAIRAIADTMRPQFRALSDKMMQNRKQMAALAAAGKTAESDVRPLADAQGKAMADLIVLRTQMRGEVEKVLTEAQRKQLRDMRGQWRGNKG